MQFPSLKSLNQNGVLHIAAPLIVLIVVAIAGTGYIVYSRAERCTYERSPDDCVRQSDYGTDCNSKAAPGSRSAECATRQIEKDAEEIKRKAQRELQQDYENRQMEQANRQARDIKKRKAAAKQDANSKGGSRSSASVGSNVPAGDPATTQAVNTAPLANTSAAQTLANIPPPNPEGDIEVVTWLDDPDKKGKEDGRLGNVSIKIERAGGNADCATHTKGVGMTNAKKYKKRKSDKKKVNATGTINFIACTAGSYTVSMEGRKGYHIRSGTATRKTVSVSDNHTTRVEFVLAKDVQTKAKKGKKTTSSAERNTQPTKTGQALANASVNGSLTKTAFNGKLTTGQVNYAVAGVNCSDIKTSHKWQRFKGGKLVQTSAYKKGSGKNLAVEGSFKLTAGAGNCTISGTIYAGKAFTESKHKGNEIQDQLTIKAGGKTRTFNTNRIAVGQ